MWITTTLVSVNCFTKMCDPNYNDTSINPQTPQCMYTIYMYIYCTTPPIYIWVPPHNVYWLHNVHTQTCTPPTLHSILTKNISLPFRVNHSQFHPTHKLTWDPHELDYPHSHYVLKAIKHIKSGMEISFDYNYGSVILSIH